MSKNEVTLRQQAVQKWLSGASKKSIARELSKTRFWVSYWIDRYQADDPEGSLQNRSKAPKHPYRKWPEEIVQTVCQYTHVNAPLLFTHTAPVIFGNSAPLLRRVCVK